MLWLVLDPGPSRESRMWIGVLTGGGGWPARPPPIPTAGAPRARRGRAGGGGGSHYGSEVVPCRDGWRGLLENRTTPLDIAAVDGLLTRGGTTLGSARVAPERIEDGLSQKQKGLDP